MGAGRIRSAANAGAMLLALAFASLRASPAAAVFVEVDFVGVVHTVSGTIPGSPGVGSSFSGTLKYESGQTAEIDEDPFTAVYTFSDDSAALSILLEGVTWGTDPASPAMTMTVTVDRKLDTFTGEVVSSSDPFALFAGPVVSSSTGNLDVGAGLYTVELEYVGIAGTLGMFNDPVPSLADALLPPSPSELVAQQLGFAVIRIDGTGFSVVGSVTSAVPEPATGLLLAAGLLVLGARRH